MSMVRSRSWHPVKLGVEGVVVSEFSMGSAFHRRRVPTFLVPVTFGDRDVVERRARSGRRGDDAGRSSTAGNEG